MATLKDIIDSEQEKQDERALQQQRQDLTCSIQSAENAFAESLPKMLNFELPEPWEWGHVKTEKVLSQEEIDAYQALFSTFEKTYFGPGGVYDVKGHKRVDNGVAAYAITAAVAVGGAAIALSPDTVPTSMKIAVGALMASWGLVAGFVGMNVGYIQKCRAMVHDQEDHTDLYAESGGSLSTDLTDIYDQTLAMKERVLSTEIEHPGKGIRKLFARFKYQEAVSNLRKTLTKFNTILGQIDQYTNARDDYRKERDELTAKLDKLPPAATNGTAPAYA